MLHSQYLRLERIAGGTSSSVSNFVRACHTVLSEKGKTRALRDVRHTWIREGLELRNKVINYIETNIVGK